MSRGVYIKTEEHRQKLREAQTGKKYSKESRQKMSRSAIGKKKPPFTEEHKRNISLHHARPHLGKHLSENQKRSISERFKGKKISNEHKKKISESRLGVKHWGYGKKVSEEIRQKISLALIKIGHRPRIQFGKDNFNWKGGIKSKPYPSIFNVRLKLKIRTRDNFTCCLCGRTEREELEELNYVLCVNHIDFDKNNCKESNLNTLCRRCNVKINRDREYWTNYFTT